MQKPRKCWPSEYRSGKDGTIDITSSTQTNATSGRCHGTQCKHHSLFRHSSRYMGRPCFWPGTNWCRHNFTKHSAGPSQLNPNHKNNIVPIPIEDQIIAMCSNGNTSTNYRNLEIKHRATMANEQLNHIRNLIAEKSFQFSHIIRVSPRKSITTRARGAVKKLSNQIAEHCWFYARCRASLLILGADESILSRFKVLNPVDIAGSTAVLKPNQPGLTKLKLSWIWQSTARNIITYAGHRPGDLAEDLDAIADGPSSVLECMSMFCIFFSDIYLFKSGEFTGCVPELKKCDGKRKLHWPHMRCNGLSDILFTRANFGPISEKYRPLLHITIPVPLHIQNANIGPGISLHLKLIRLLN